MGRSSLLHQKHNVGCFLLKRFVEISSEYVFYTLLVETCRKQKLVQSKALQQKLFALILGFWQCRQVFVTYLMSILMTCKYTGGYIYQVVSAEYSFAAKCSEKFPFYRNIKGIKFTVRWSVKYFFCSELTSIPDKAGRKTRRKKRTQAIAKRYAFHGNAKSKRNNRYFTFCGLNFPDWKCS